MYTIAETIHCLFPLIAFVLLIIGIKSNAIYYVISALWVSLIALVIHFQASGGEILGGYFNYYNASIYTANLVILIISLIRVTSHLSSDNSLFKLSTSLFQALLVIGGLLLLTNLWINAYFIETRLVGTPVMQVGLMQKADYCGYKYVFYKVGSDGKVLYLCPNHYGLIPSIGHLSTKPDFIANQLSLPNKRQLVLQKDKI